MKAGTESSPRGDNVPVRAAPRHEDCTGSKSRAGDTMGPTPSKSERDTGRSRERADQDQLLDREARRESWLTRLRRHRWFNKGRPEPGNRGNRDLGSSDRSAR